MKKDLKVFLDVIKLARWILIPISILWIISGLHHWFYFGVELTSDKILYFPFMITSIILFFGSAGIAVDIMIKEHEIDKEG